MEQTYSGVRESIPGRVVDAGGTGQGLAEQYEKGCLKKADRSFATALQCQQINSLGELMSMEDSVLVVHSPKGCCGCAVLAADGYRVGQVHRGVTKVKNPHVMLTNLDQNNVIFGGEKKLRETIQLSIDRYHPKVIFIMASCASGIIGDDIDAVANTMQEEVEPLLIPVHCEGFKSKLCQSGVDAVFMSVSKYLMPKEKPEKQPNLINMFAPRSISYKDEQEMTRLLNELGMEVNYVPFYSSIEKFQRIAKASYSTSICKQYGDEFMKTLEKDYDIPYSLTVMPIGMRNTDKWLRSVGKLIGKEEETEALIEREHKRVEPLVEDIRARLGGKRAFVCGGMARSFACAALLEDYHMELVGLETPIYDDYAQEDIEYFNKIHKDYVVDIGFMQPFEQANLLKRIKPDVLIGTTKLSPNPNYPNTTPRGGNGYGIIRNITVKK